MSPNELGVAALFIKFLQHLSNLCGGSRELDDPSTLVFQFDFYAPFDVFFQHTGFSLPISPRNPIGKDCRHLRILVESAVYFEGLSRFC